MLPAYAGHVGKSESGRLSSNKNVFPGNKKPSKIEHILNAVVMR